MGPFGRATVHLSTRGVVSHAHAEYNLLFKIGGADACFECNGQSLALNDQACILLNPWESHSKRDLPAGTILLLSLLIRPDWIASTLDLPAALGGRLFARSQIMVS